MSAANLKSKIKTQSLPVKQRDSCLRGVDSAAVKIFVESVFLSKYCT